MVQTADYITDGLQIEHETLRDNIDTSIEINYYFQHKIEIITRFRIEGKSHQYKFSYSQAYLNRFENSFEKPFSLFATSSLFHNEQSDVCCKLKDVFVQLANTKLKGVYHTIFLESQALLVLLHTHTDCDSQQEPTCFNCKFLNDPIEKQKIMQARVIVMINLSEPPTIPQLARAVHINECYLKKGFKEMYGTSIFDFVQQQRVHKAKQILKSNKLSIQQLALELGYSNTSNFTNAFKKMTGKAPTEWIKEFS